MAAFLVYGSLYPFQLRPLPEHMSVIAALTSAWVRWPGGRGDLLVNLVLYMPFGLFLALALGTRLRSAAAVLALATLAGATLSLALEIGQLRIVGRFSSLSDLALNTVGSFAGALMGWFGPKWVGTNHLGTRRGLADPGTRAEPFALLLVLAWLGYRLYPYVFVIDLHQYWSNLKPILLSPTFEPAATLRRAVLWMTAACLLSATAPSRGPLAAPLLIPTVLAGTLIGQILLIESRLSLAELLGIALALVGWFALRCVERKRTTLIVLSAALAGTILDDRLAPFVFQADARPLGWLPFRAVLQGPWETALQAVLHKLYLYGGLLWLLVRTGLRLPIAAALVTCMLLATSLLQTHIAGRSAEITDVVLGLAAAAVLELLQARANGGRGMAVRSEFGDV